MSEGPRQTSFRPDLIDQAVAVEIHGMTAGGRIRRGRWGAAHVHPAFPFLREANFLHLRPAPLLAAGPPALGALAEALLEIGALVASGSDPFPRLFVTDEAATAALEAPLQLLGYERRDLRLWLRHPTAPIPTAPDGVEVRPAVSVEDLDRVDALHRYALPDVDDELAGSIINARRQELDEHLGTRWRLAWDEGRAVGAAATFVHGRVGSVQWVRTADGQRGRGIGRALVSQLCAGLHERGVEVISLLCEDPNDAAAALYRRLDFQPSRRLTFFEVGEAP